MRKKRDGKNEGGDKLRQRRRRIKEAENERDKENE